MNAAPGRAPRGQGHGLRLGVIGFGRLAQQYYVPALQRRHGIADIVVADPLPASRAAAARALAPVRCFAEVEALLATRPDAVVVATPPSTHLALWNTLADRGIPVLMEKPFLLRGELARAARGANVEALLMIDFNRRFWPPYVKLAELVRQGAIGALETVEIGLHVDVTPWCRVTAHRLAAGEGGVLYDLGSQALDLACTVAGSEPTRLIAHGSSRRWTYDHIRLDAELANGARVRCDLAYETPTFERVDAVGGAGRLTLADPNMRLHLNPPRGAVARARRRVGDVATLGYYGLRRAHSMARASIATALDRFVAAAASGAPFSPGFADAARNAAWLEQVRLEVRP